MAKLSRSNIPRLDPSLVKDNDVTARLHDYLEDRLAECEAQWNPHNKLEFLKVCIRSLAEKEQADRKVRECREEEDTN